MARFSFSAAWRHASRDASIKSMISMLLPMPIGNALQLWLKPPESALLWRVLRTTGTTFAGVDDAAADLVYQGDQATYLVDTDGLLNGVPYSYCAFYFDGAAWTPSAIVVGTPDATYYDQTTDVLSVVIARLEVGLQVEVERGVLNPQEGSIAVQNAPPAIEDTRWPVVTVQVISDGSGDRAVGEHIADDDFDALTGETSEAQGWLARVTLSIIGWSKNPLERITLRQVLRRLVIANLNVFDAAGVQQIDFNQQDVNEMGSSPPIYATEGTFTCLAPAVVRDDVSNIETISVTGTASFSPPA